MHRRITAALAAGALAVGGVLAGTVPAFAAPAFSSYTDCTIHTRAGRVIVTAVWSKQGLMKTGAVSILSVDRVPFRLLTDRVGPLRGAAGMASPGVPRTWRVGYPVAFYTHASVRVQGPDGSVGACSAG